MYVHVPGGFFPSRLPTKISYEFLISPGRGTFPDHPILITTKLLNSIERPDLADEEDGFYTWRIAPKIFNKQLRTADKEWYSNMGVMRG